MARHPGWTCGDREVYPIQFDRISRQFTRSKSQHSNLVISRIIFTLSPEGIQRSHHLEELKPPKRLTLPRVRHIHLPTLCHLGADGIRKFEGIPSPFPERPKIEIGNIFYAL